MPPAIATSSTTLFAPITVTGLPDDGSIAYAAGQLAALGGTVSVGGMPVVSSSTVAVAENAGATPLGIQAPSDPNFDVAQLVITVRELPSIGTVTLANGTPVAVGDTLSVGELTGLFFTPSAGVFNQNDTFSYGVTDPDDTLAVGTAQIDMGGATGNPVVAPASLTVQEDQAATPIGMAAPSDPNYPRADLVITVGTLPSDGTVELADGTPLSSGQALTVDQLGGLLFLPADGQFNQVSSLAFTVTDPAGNSSSGAATLAIGPSTDVDPSTGSALPVIDRDLNGAFAITNVDADRAGGNNGSAYTGADPSIQHQFIWPGTQGIAVRADLPNTLLAGGTGGDALQVTGGDNILDGGTGSNFLVGGTGADGGADEFDVDISGPAVTWNTLVAFHPGDEVTIRGFQPGTSSGSWAGWSGAPGYAGATLNIEAAGAGTGVTASVTFAGMTQADASSKLSITAGTTNGLGYLQISDHG